MPIYGGTSGSGLTDNLVATTNPGVTNDVDEGYGVGSMWVNVTSDVAYICLDNTDGAAVWTEVTAGAAGGNAWSDAVNADIVPDGDGTRDLGATLTRFAETYTDALDVTNNITVGGTVDGRDVAADGTKLDTVETNADVTDETNVKSAVGGGTFSSIVTLAGADELLARDVSDSNNMKVTTVTDILNLVDNIAVSELADGTDGELITWDAAGAPTTVAAGTSGHVLTSNGAGAAPTFQAASGGGVWTDVSSGTASTVTSLDFDVSGCDWARIIITNLTVSNDNRDIELRVSDDDGATFESGLSEYYYHYDGVTAAGTALAGGNASDDSVILTPALSLGSATNEHLMAIIDVFDPDQASAKSFIRYQVTYFEQNNGVMRTNNGSAHKNTASDIDQIRVFPAANTMSCNYKLIKMTF